MAGNNNIDRDGIEHGDDDKKDIVLITNIDIYLNSVGAMLSAIYTQYCNYVGENKYFYQNDILVQYMVKLLRWENIYTIFPIFYIFNIV